MNTEVMEKFYKGIEELSVHSKDSQVFLEKINKTLEDFSKKVESTDIARNLRKNRDMYELATNVLENIKNGVSSWNAEINKLIKEEKLREELRNEFVVIIYGKVKAGKSTLGNFVAKNPISKKLNKKPFFFVYDKAGNKQIIKELQEIRDDSGFKTDTLECTSEIQGFKLDGLAWIDTPGLASMNKENGELSKQYINAADFIIFPTSSDSPMQRTEMKEIGELIEYKKVFYIVITKSDTFEEDEKDDEIVRVIVNKSPSTRNAQEEDVRKRLKEELDNVKDEILKSIISISVLTAKKGLEENDKELFEGSNIKEFYSLMNEKLVKKAEFIKNSSREDRLGGFIENVVLENMNNLKQQLTFFDEKKAEIRKKLERLKSDSVNDVYQIVNFVVAKKRGEINSLNIKLKVKEIIKEINNEIKGSMIDNLKSVFDEFDQALIDFRNNLDPDKYKIEGKYEKIKISREIAYKGTGGSIGGLIGGIIGGALGELGAFIGAAIGSYIGEKIGGAVSTEKVETVKIGDTKEETLAKLREDLTKIKAKEVQSVYEYILQSFLYEIDKSTLKIHKLIEDFENKMKELLQEIRR